MTDKTKLAQLKLQTRMAQFDVARAVIENDIVTLFSSLAALELRRKEIMANYFYQQLVESECKKKISKPARKKIK